MSKDNKSKKHHNRKNYVVLPYITTPIIFVLIFMIVAVPAFFGVMHIAKDKVHNAQHKLVLSCYDVAVSDDNKDGTIDVCEKVGTIKCDSVGISTDVYYGVNRVSLRSGAAMAFRTDDNGMYIAGYSCSVFRRLDKVKKGDIIEFVTADGEKRYVVEKIANKYDKDNVGSDRLVISTTVDNTPFSYYDDEKLYVIAKEVPYEQ